MATITCENCGAERKNTPSNTKRCRICVAHHSLTFMMKWNESHETKCVLCRKPFNPEKRSVELCATCDVLVNDTHLLRDECGICKGETPPNDLYNRDRGYNQVVPGVKACRACFQSPDKFTRHRVLAGLQARINKQRQENQWTPA